MEDHSRLKLNSRVQQSVGTFETVATEARKSLTQHDRFKLEKPTFPYADVHHQYTKNVKDTSPKKSGNFLKQHRKATQEEELVKYMSNLPSYLEKGAYHQEKVLNFGVLDWGQLEKWQCSQKHISQRNSRYSLSSGNSSSSPSTEGSSVNSSSSQSCSPAHQRLHRPSLEFHLMSSPTEVRSQDVKTFEENIQKFQHFKGYQAKNVNVREELVMAGEPFSKNFAEIKLDNCNRKAMDSKINPKSGTFRQANFEAMQKMKEKTNIRDGECMKMVNKLQGQKADAAEQDVSQKSKRVGMHPRDISQGDRAQISKSTTMLGVEGAETSGRSISEMPESSPGVISSDVPHSCPLICESNGCTEIKWCFSDVESVSLLSDSSRSVPHQAKRGTSPCRGRISEIKKSSVAPITSTSKEPSAVSELKPNKMAAEKPRSTSPFRRLTIGMGKISKSFNSKEDLSHLNTTRNFAKSKSEIAVAPSCHSTSSDMQNATSRARSSPLRRLLDPLLKPKAPNCHQSWEPSERDLVSTDRACKSSGGQVDPSTGARQPGIVKLDMACCREINIDDSTQGKKRGSSAFQAFLQVAIKNGQPVFTFAVDNEKNVLAATMKKLSSLREDEFSCIYTFLAFKEVKKKNGKWINQGGKDNSHDYIPNVVAQLKVSGSQYFGREFVLFSVNLRQAEQQTLDLQANDELAAIVVKIPKVINKSMNTEQHQSNNCNDFPEVRFDSTSGEHCMMSSQSLISTTIILPSGVHSLPNKGGPSSLIQRWRSGGSCDCGGWDLGCKLRIFSNDNVQIKKSSSSKACSISDKFELISQGGEGNRPVFSLAPFKDGIYSVEFTSALSKLQAFSLCIAFLDSKKLCDSSENNFSLETILSQNDGIRAAPNGIDGGCSCKIRLKSTPFSSRKGLVL